MNARQFYSKVVAMREAQKEYFRTRSTQALQKSKAIEKEIDDEIKRVETLLDEQEQKRQLNLFGNEFNENER